MAYVTKKKLSDNTIVLIGSNLYGVCNTASGTAEKSVAIAGFDVLEDGVTIHVYFTHSNTASDPALKVGTTEAKPVRRNGVGGKWENNSVVSFTYASGYWHQNDADDASGTTYGLAYNASTKELSLVEGGQSDSVVIPNDNTSYTLTKNGNTITLTGSDGSTASVTDENTEYGLSFVNGVLSLVRGGSDLTANIPDTDTTYTITINGDQLTLTPSSGTPQTITLPTGGLKYVEDVGVDTDLCGVRINDVQGNLVGGQYALAEGWGTEADAVAAHSEGYKTRALGNNSHAEGEETRAIGRSSHAEGGSTKANGNSSHAEGSGAEAKGSSSHAEGFKSIAEGNASHAEGIQSNALGDSSHAEGARTSAGGGYAHAEGAGTQANGVASHAEGNTTHAFGDYSHASGDHVTALGESQTAFGKYNDPNANYALIIGGGTDINNLLNILTVDWSGNIRALGLVNEVLIYDKVNKLHVAGAIGSGKDGADGLISQQQGEGTNRDITSWNIEGMDLSAFRSLKIIARRNNATYGTTCKFELPLEGDTVPTRDIYVSGASVSAHCDRNRLNIINCAVDSTKSKFCVTQTFSLYGTAATTVSDFFVEKIYGCY